MKIPTDVSELKVQNVKSIEHKYIIVPEGLRDANFYDVPGTERKLNQYVININTVRNTEYFGDIVFYDLVTIESNEPSI